MEMWGFVFFYFTNLRFTPYIPLKWWVIFLKSWTSTSNFSNLTSSFVTSGWFTKSRTPIHMTQELKPIMKFEWICLWFTFVSSTHISPISAVYKLELHVAMKFHPKYHSLQWLSQLVYVIIRSYIVLYLSNENLIFYQEKSFVFYIVQTTYWTTVSKS